MAEFFDSPQLNAAWHVYIKYVFASSHLALSASSFLIMSATFERFVCLATKWTVKRLASCWY